MSVIIILLIFVFLNIITILNASRADYGGNHGYALSFSQVDQYASVPGYFSPGSFWPVDVMTVSSWIRYTGVQVDGRYQNFAFSVVVNGDSDHVQTFNFVIVNGEANFLIFVAGQGINCVLPPNTNLWDYWTKTTATFHASQNVSFYLNDTLLCTQPINSNLLRWSDSGTLIFGGYALSANTLGNNEHFIGWVDDFAVYNRVMEPSEIAETWDLAADTSDPSLVIYYNFDEGPGHDTFLNRGVAGHQADLLNGKIYSALFYYETDSQSLRSTSPATIVPGSPAKLRSSFYSTPLVFGLDLNVYSQLTITCPNSLYLPSDIHFLSYNGSGLAYDQANQTQPSTFPFHSADASFFLQPITPGRQTIEYSCVCDGSIITSYLDIFVSNPPQADPSLMINIVAGTQLMMYLDGLQDRGNLLLPQITQLPTKGSLYQLNFSNTIDLSTPILTVPTNLTNPIMGLIYVPNPGETGVDTFLYLVNHDHLASEPAPVTISIQSWNDLPSTSSSQASIFNRNPMELELSSVDHQQVQYLGVYITSLPTKGTLYQVYPNGTRGPPIEKVFSPYVVSVPTFHFGQQVVNVSSFWGGSDSWSPIQILGPQDCFSYGDCVSAWCPLTVDGNDNWEDGSNGKGLNFHNNPNIDYAKYGYTEYIEVQYNESLFVTDILIGENLGMGSVLNILAKDPHNNWMTLYSQPVDPKIQKLYYEFSQYRLFNPDICNTPFKTNHIRLELDTRDIPDWNELDFLRMGGTSDVDESMVAWNGDAVWKVIYEPFPWASGLDSFTFAANDCPTKSQRWSPQGTVTLNIVPTGVAGNFSVNHLGVANVDLGLWSRDSKSSTFQIPSSFTLTSLPPSGRLLQRGNQITSVPFHLNGSLLTYYPDPSCETLQTEFSYFTSDVNEKAPVTIQIFILCQRHCESKDMVYEVQDSCLEGSRKVVFNWNQSRIGTDCLSIPTQFKLRNDYLGIPCGEVSFQTSSFPALIFFSLITALVGGFFILIFYLRRHSKTVKLLQPGLSTLNLLGGIAFQFSWLAYLGPMSEASCMLRPWLLAISSSIMLGSLIRKVRVIIDILHANSTTKSNLTIKPSPPLSPRQSSWTSFFNLSKTWWYLGGFFLLDLLILLPWSTVSPSHPSSTLFQVSGLGMVSVSSYECNSKSDLPLSLLLIAIKSLLVIWGIYTLYKIQSLGQRFL